MYLRMPIKKTILPAREGEGEYQYVFSLKVPRDPSN
jgi:hypothetical protein